MRKTLVVFGCTALAGMLLASSISARTPARENPRTGYRPYQVPTRTDQDALEALGRPVHRAAAADTVDLAFFSFESGPSCASEGWTSHDMTAQLQDFFHVDDYAGLGGGDFGLLTPLEGAHSLWCGARPSTADPLCDYASLPGYGNNWDQAYCTKACLNVTGDVVVDFLMAHDVEELPYDPISVEFDDGCNDAWQTVAQYGGFGAGFSSVEIPDSLYGGSLKIRFHVITDGAWSDQDGLFNTDGALHIDSLTVSDGGGIVLATELFEGASVPDWEGCTPPGFGDFAGLFRGFGVLQEDPCRSNLSCFWGFFNNSTTNYACGGHSEQLAVPYENSRGQYISNEIWSPYIPWTGTGQHGCLAFDIYRDLPLNSLVFYVWHVRSIVGGCPGPWRDRTFYYGGEKQWLRDTFPFGDLVAPGATEIQIALGVFDICPLWCDIYGSGGCHSHAPLFDNVEVFRVDRAGPQWSGLDIRMFQDNFAADGTLTGTARADIALDVSPVSAAIVPGDSAVVTCADPYVGLAGDPNTSFGPAVYLYVGVFPQGQAAKSGGALTQDPFRWPVVGSQSIGSNTWWIVRADSVFARGHRHDLNFFNDFFCVDLNDNLFTPGDTVFFFWGAGNAVGQWTYYNVETGERFDAGEAASLADEFTILPVEGLKPGGDVLYVDQMNFRGAQPYFDSVFEFFGIYPRIDRFDVRGPSFYAAGNRLSSRVQNVFNQILGVYKIIIFNSGDLSLAPVSNGSLDGEKSDDAGLFATFLDNLQTTGGIYFSGDDLAEKWASGGGSLASLSNFMLFTLTSGDHQPTYGVSPFVVGEPGGIFEDGSLVVDSVVAYGGCPVLTDFDVIEPQAATSCVKEATYHGNGSSGGGAVLAQSTNNSAGFDVGVVLSGYSFHSVRDVQDWRAGYPSRVEHFIKILRFIDSAPFAVVGAGDSPRKTSLAQNYPNPFNPQTTIRYTLKEKARVSLKVYNVAGQLVKTLVDDVQSPARVTPVTWNGRNNAGQPVASGVYFYKLVTKGFTQTKKMVLLK